MARYDFRMQRLYVNADLADGVIVEGTPDQANYLLNVLRLKSGGEILMFNGRQGEWRARVEPAGRKGCRLTVVEQVRAQEGGPDLHYVFAPLKRARLDYMVEKATELGASRLLPVFTRYSQAERINLDRLRANVIEAGEQCGVLRLPEVAEPRKLEALIADWPADRLLVFCDEDAPVRDPVAALREAAGGAGREPLPIGVLIGPEGGFAPEERDRLLAVPGVLRLAMGPRIMRADTAAIAALTLVNAVLGDWR